MEGHILYLVYLAIILAIGILATAFTKKLGISNILLLLLAGFILKLLNLDYFSREIVLVLSSLAMILMIVETTMRLHLKHILKNFISSIWFLAGFFAISVYFTTLLLFYFFGIPGKTFDVLVLCILLGMLVYTANPGIALEFLKRRRGRVFEIMEIEGIVSSLLTIVFSLYLIRFLAAPTDNFSSGLLFQIFELLKQFFIAVLFGFAFAWLIKEVIRHFNIGSELLYLLIISVGILGFGLSELIKLNGGFVVAVYGLFLGGFISRPVLKYTPLFTHALYIIVFILLGIKTTFPGLLLWIKGLLVFAAYLFIRFICIHLFIKGLKIKEKAYLALNVAKDIEAAVVLFIMQLSLGHLPGINLVVSLGFMFFVYSYVASTLANRIKMNGN